MEIATYAMRFTKEAREAGFPMQFGAVTQAPFDTLSDFFRGMKGTMLDMYRRPEKVIQACEKLLPFMIEMAVNGDPGLGKSPGLHPHPLGARQLHVQGAVQNVSSGPPCGT